jgi:valyl-tRNA synthetase
MNTTYLFAIDSNTEEVIVSESAKGTNKIDFIERISRTENDILYNAVVTLTSISQDPNLDVSIFKASDKLCQLIYAKHCLKK